jgi:HEAT repeat protein
MISNSSQPPHPDGQAQLAALGAADADALVALVDADDDTALAAISLLGRVGRKPHSAPLLRVLAGPRAELWMASAVALTLLESRRPTGRLLALLDEVSAEEQRFAVAYALAFTRCALADPRVRPALMRVLGDGAAPARVRGIAAEGLGNMLGSCFGVGAARDAAFAATGDLLIAMLDDPAPEVRFWATFALGSLRYRAALPRLREVAATDAASFGGWWTVGAEASDAIDNIEGREPPERIVQPSTGAP